MTCLVLYDSTIAQLGQQLIECWRKTA